MVKVRRRPLLAGIGAALAPVLAACGGGSSGGSGGAASEHQSDRGPITYVQGKDNTGDVKNIIAKWNSLHPDQKVTLKEQSDNADQQHDDLVQHFKAKD